MINSYISSLSEQAKANNNRLRFGYYNARVPTGRLASGGDKKNPYFAFINIQSSPKPHPMNWYVHDYHEGDEVSEGDVVVLDWRFSLTEKSNKIVEGFNPEGNFRRALIAEEGCYWVSCDFCISPDTEVETNEGIKKLREFEGRDDILVKTPDGFKRAYNFRWTGKKKKCRLRLKDGREVICSPDHKFKVVRDGKEMWLPLKDIKISDYVITD